MAIFFAFYYYTLSKQFDYDVERMPKREPSVFARWNDCLSTNVSYEQEANKGQALAC